MTEEKVAIKKSTVQNGLILVIAVAGILYFTLSPTTFSNAYLISLVLSAAIIGWGAFYFYKLHHELDEMCCMMNGMVFSMMASFVIGTIIALPTGDFVLGIIIGTIVGLGIGIPLGKLGGHLSKMEGIMAAPMGGSMGAMLGIMMRFYEIQVFMQYLLIILLFVIIEMTRINYSGKKMSKTMLYSGVVLSVLVIISVFMLNFSVDNSATTIVFGKSTTQAINEAQLNNNLQEVNIRMEALGYSPNNIIVKKGIPVKINLEAAPDAGCTRSIVFPDFGITKVVPKNGKAVVEFRPQREGTFTFRCSMAMASGTLTVKA